MKDIDEMIRKGLDSVQTDSPIDLPSHLDALNPMYYEQHPQDFPPTCIDHFDNTPRTIRCISDGSAELEYLTRGDQYFGINSPISWIDLDDFTYYLQAIVENGALTVGKEYKLVDAYPESDVEFGIVEIMMDDEVIAVPAFLFEELKPITLEKRKKSIEEYWKKIDAEIENENKIGGKDVGSDPGIDGLNDSDLPFS